ncbi:hypothetical protein DFH08DRAFT_962125 [Mycena albidolilacea]|uniref:Uncharacterized protein n=1 Tax=Mycena albidolilacea TaxID=1033008 RepID=A0AAD6ZYE3_9AGAR|nr:hypothetical protein DFH08DRAFT_962125 [Mycena albidolilacea]
MPCGRSAAAPGCSVHPATSASLHTLTMPNSAPAPSARLACSPARPWTLVPRPPASHQLAPRRSRFCGARRCCTSASSIAPNPAPRPSYVHGALALERLAYARSPAGPRSTRLLTTANHSTIHSAHHALTRRTSNSALCPVYCTAPTYTARSASVLLHYKLVRMLPALPQRVALLRPAPATHLRPDGRRWHATTRASIPLAFAPAPHAPPLPPQQPSLERAMHACSSTLSVPTPRSHHSHGGRATGQDASRLQSVEIGHDEGGGSIELNVDS